MYGCTNHQDTGCKSLEDQVFTCVRCQYIIQCGFYAIFLFFNSQLLLEDEENLTLDQLFNMLNHDLEQLLTRHCVAITEGKKLLVALDLLTVYYGKCYCILNYGGKGLSSACSQGYM